MKRDRFKYVKLNDAVRRVGEKFNLIGIVKDFKLPRPSNGTGSSNFYAFLHLHLQFKKNGWFSRFREADQSLKVGFQNLLFIIHYILCIFFYQKWILSVSPSCFHYVFVHLRSHKFSTNHILQFPEPQVHNSISPFVYLFSDKCIVIRIADESYQSPGIPLTVFGRRFEDLPLVVSPGDIIIVSRVNVLTSAN